MYSPMKPKYPHMMYKGKSKIKVTNKGQHDRLEAMGYTHKKPTKK